MPSQLSIGEGWKMEWSRPKSQMSGERESEKTSGAVSGRHRNGL